jgi:hypothetical protein
MADLTRPVVRDAIKAAVASGDIAVAATSAATFHVNEYDRAWVDALCGPQPLATMTQPVRITGARDRIPRKAYIRAAANPNTAFDAAFARVKADPSWASYAVPGGHDVMVDQPQRLADILLDVA